jgi:hypothetical protein
MGDEDVHLHTPVLAHLAAVSGGRARRKNPGQRVSSFRIGNPKQARSPVKGKVNAVLSGRGSPKYDPLLSAQ